MRFEVKRSRKEGRIFPGTMYGIGKDGRNECHRHVLVTLATRLFLQVKQQIANLVVFRNMARSNSRQATEASGYQVRAPRAGDAIGFALRDAYDQEYGLPDDMAALLRQLNGRNDSHSSH